MDIRKKTNCELQNQANKFLAHVSEVGKITEKEGKKIAKILGLNESEKKGFLNRLSKKFGKEVDISDIGQIKQLLNKKNIDFGKLYDEYLMFLGKYGKARKKAKEFLDDSDLLNYNNGLLDLLTHICVSGNEKILQRIKNLKGKYIKIYTGGCKYCSDSYEEFEILEYIDKNLDAKNFAKTIFGKYPDITTEEFCLCFENLSPKVFNLIIDKYPNLSMDELKLLISDKKIYDVDGYSLLFKKFPNISFGQFISLSGRSSDVKFLKTLFRLYPNVTASDFIFFIICFNIFDLYHDYGTAEYILQIMEKTLFDLTFQEALTLIAIPSGHNQEYCEFIFQTYKNKIKNIRGKQDASIEELFSDNETLSQFTIRQLENLRFIFKKYGNEININWLEDKDLGLSGRYHINYNSIWDLSAFEYLKKICKRFPEISIGQLSELSKSKTEDLDEIFKIYPDITIESLAGLVDILENAEPENMKTIFEKYPDITASDLSLLKDVVNTAEQRNLNEIFKQYPEVTIEKLITINDILKSAYDGELKILFKQYPNITIDELISIKAILAGQHGSLEQIFKQYPDISFKKLVLTKDIIHSVKAQNLETIFTRYPDITIEKLISIKDILIYSKPETLANFLKFFSPIGISEISKYQYLFGSKGYLPENLTFKEKDHKGYLKYFEELNQTSYDGEKKSKIIKKMVTLTFNEVKNYLDVFKMFDDSISMDIQRIKDELIEEVLNSENPKVVTRQINNIFERNNLPLTGKIFKVFELLYPKEKFKKSLQPHGSPILHHYLDEGKNVYSLIYKDLMNIAIKSGDRSLKNYINTFIGSEKLLKKFEDIVSSDGFNGNDPDCLKDKLEETEQTELLYLFRKFSVLYNRYYGNEINEGNTIEDKKYGESIVADNQLVEFYNEIKKGFRLKNGESIYDRLQRFLWGLGYHSFNEVLKDMDESKKQAHERGLKLYNDAVDNGGKISFPKRAFLKGVTEDAFSKIINRGVTCREYLGGGDDGNAAGSDLTPFDTDGIYVNEPTIWTCYGNINLVIDTTKGNIYDTRNLGTKGYTHDKYELFYLGRNHYGIRTGIPMTEVAYIIYHGNSKQKEFQNICYEIVRNGYYIPVTDNEGNIKFTPEMYHKIRAGFNYMKYYDGFDVNEVEGKYEMSESDNEIHRTGSDEELNALISENSPTNEKYINFAEKNKELAENTIKWITEILENECGIKLNSKFDSSIVGAELYDSGSTGRGTDIPTKDVDLDFTLILDEKDYESVSEIKRIIHERIGTLKNDDHNVQEGGNQIKSKINNIGKSDERPNGVPLDLLILKKSQVIDYSSSDAMKEKLDYIKDNLGEEDYNFVRTNIIVMKKLLKAKGCYKKPEGGMAGIGVENWIIQNHGSFIEALESFEQVAYGGKYGKGKQPISLHEFQVSYPIYDAGENYKDGCNDNFVDKLEGNGYFGILEIIKTFRMEGIDGIRNIIKEYETKKADYIN